jgi:hypothetical protein
MLPHADLPPETASHNEPESVRREIIGSQNKKKQGKYRLALILFILLGFIIWGIWKILPYVPGLPHFVRLKSATYLRSAHVYRYDSSGYDPTQALLIPE